MRQAFWEKNTSIIIPDRLPNTLMGTYLDPKNWTPQNIPKAQNLRRYLKELGINRATNPTFKKPDKPHFHRQSYPTSRYLDFVLRWKFLAAVLFNRAVSKGPLFIDLRPIGDQTGCFTLRGIEHLIAGSNQSLGYKRFSSIFKYFG